MKKYLYMYVNESEPIFLGWSQKGPHIYITNTWESFNLFWEIIFGLSLTVNWPFYFYLDIRATLFKRIVPMLFLFTLIKFVYHTHQLLRCYLNVYSAEKMPTVEKMPCNMETLKFKIDEDERAKSI